MSHTQMHTRVCEHTHAHKCTHTLFLSHTQTHKHTHTHTNTHTHTHTHARTHAHIHTHTYANTHSRTHTYIRTNNHTHTSVTWPELGARWKSVSARAIPNSFKMMIPILCTYCCNFYVLQFGRNKKENSTSKKNFQQKNKKHITRHVKNQSVPGRFKIPLKDESRFWSVLIKWGRSMLDYVPKKTRDLRHLNYKL